MLFVALGRSQFTLLELACCMLLLYWGYHLCNVWFRGNPFRFDFGSEIISGDPNKPHELGGGFKYCLFSSLPGEMLRFDSWFSNGLVKPQVFQMGWNHQLVNHMLEHVFEAIYIFSPKILPFLRFKSTGVSQLRWSSNILSKMSSLQV